MAWVPGSRSTVPSLYMCSWYIYYAINSNDLSRRQNSVVFLKWNLTKLSNWLQALASLLSIIWACLSNFPILLTTYQYCIHSTKVLSDTWCIFAGISKWFNCGWILPIVWLRVHNTNKQLRLCNVHLKSSCHYQFIRKTMASKAKWCFKPEKNKIQKMLTCI